ncbi:AMP-binding protein [Massilia horti]|uniref:Long-chain-fatty-acid--CoA ligase n=1 Tax=Massilia horti TaxID=2562153 RepID=A0A4Y9SWC2_9BURK|nr:AMP-binding protein [Massilia horti]TFW30765.1 long-chain-fatty-acid--CoA ligase [Massilia horti]
MEKIWLKSYPPGVPAEVDLDRFNSLSDLLAWIADRFPSQDAFSNQGSTLSWERLDTLARQFAAYLHKIGLRKGDRIAIMLPNLLQYPVGLFGALRAGCVVVNVNPQYTAQELQYQLNDSGASAILILDNFAHTLERVLDSTPVRHVITTRVADMLEFPRATLVNISVKRVRYTAPRWNISGAVTLAEALREGENVTPPDPKLGPEDTAFLQYTGGTTGMPKGAILTHRNLVANIEQTAAWVGGALVAGRETAVVPLPLYHIFALTVMLMFCRLGAHVVLITNPRDVPSLVRELKQIHFSALIGLNTLFDGLLNARDINTVDTSALKIAIAGGLALQRSVAERWQARFGVPIIEGYGLTEAAPIVCANPLNLQTYSGSIGLPLPSTDVALLDDEGDEVPLGEVGEICVRGPQVMKGYWNMPDETALAFTDDGWLRSGDMGYMMDDGYIKLVDSKKDVIVVSGYKVFPKEIEDVVALHPGVFEVAAIRAPDEQSDEAVKIVVVKRDPTLSAEQLIEHCKKNLPLSKVPKYVRFSSVPLPKSSIGKILRRVVMEDESQLAKTQQNASARKASR